MHKTPPDDRQPGSPGLDGDGCGMASVAFYRDILGLQPLEFEAADGSRRWALAFGAQKINLHPAQAPFAPHAAEPRAGSADLCFLSPTPG